MSSHSTILYEFDLNGFFTVENVLEPELMEALEAAWADGAPGVRAFDICFGWGDPWPRLLGEGVSQLDPILKTILGPRYKLDHAFCITEAFYSSKDKLHHQSHMVDSGIVYAVRKGRPWTTLLTLSFALRDVPPGEGGFCCVPGSHKAEFSCPKPWFRTIDHPHARQIPQKAGSCVVFTETLTHGTWPIGHERERRSILLRLTPGGVQFRRSPEARRSIRLPTIFPKIDPQVIDLSEMDEFSASLFRPPFFK